MTAQTFTKTYDNNAKKAKYVEDIVEKIWYDFDSDRNGYLDPEETRNFLQVVLKKVPGENGKYDEKAFKATYD